MCIYTYIYLFILSSLKNETIHLLELHTSYYHMFSVVYSILKYQKQSCSLNLSERTKQVNIVVAVSNY